MAKRKRKRNEKKPEAKSIKIIYRYHQHFFLISTFSLVQFILRIIPPIIHKLRSFNHSNNHKNNETTREGGWDGMRWGRLIFMCVWPNTFSLSLCGKHSALIFWDINSTSNANISSTLTQARKEEGLNINESLFAIFLHLFTVRSIIHEWWRRWGIMKRGLVQVSHRIRKLLISLSKCLPSLT